MHGTQQQQAEYWPAADLLLEVGWQQALQKTFEAWAGTHFQYYPVRHCS
jgi:hypothetical protein